MSDDQEVSAGVRRTLERHLRGSTDSQATLVLSEDGGYVGDTITFKGRNLEPDQQYEVVWHSVQGSWGVLQANEVVGQQYQPRRETILTVTAGESGAFDETWTVPEDYGGTHRVELQKEGTTVARNTFDVTPWFELKQTEAPLGEAFTIIGYGLGPEATSNNYQVVWDTGNVGFMTGVMNRGTATAQIRAVGPPGPHTIQVWRNYRGIPYLQNNTQSPFGPVAGGRQSQWTVQVTEREDPPETAWVEGMFDESPISLHYPELDEDTDATLEIAPTCGQPGTAAILTGTDFPPNTEVDLVWYQHYGQGIRGPDVTTRPREGVLPTVTSDDEGRFQLDFEIPLAEGSTRPIAAAIDGRTVAVTGFMVQPSIERFEPRSGPVGTEIEIVLSGIGWTAYENSPFFVYDNKPLGYACGMTDEHKTTTVEVAFQASGQPGYHFIDVYPSIFEMQEDEPEVEIKPHLSYLDNHPVRPLPGMHMVFEVTE
jgi:hypothetical protein